jgi:hypothetical protein
VQQSLGFSFQYALYVCYESRDSLLPWKTFQWLNENTSFLFLTKFKLFYGGDCKPGFSFLSMGFLNYTTGLILIIMDLS